MAKRDQTERPGPAGPKTVAAVGFAILVVGALAGWVLGWVVSLGAVALGVPPIVGYLVAMIVIGFAIGWVFA